MILSVIAIIGSVLINTTIGVRHQADDVIEIKYLGNNGGDIPFDNGVLCDKPLFANGIALNVDVAGGDDEGAVSLKLFCPNELIQSSKSDIGLSSDGTWSNVFCDSKVINGVRVLDGDSSVGIVSVNIRCSNGQELQPANGANNWASIDDDAQWSPWQFCPATSAICGYAQAIDPLGSADDSGLNRLAFHCCRLPIAYTEWTGEWTRVNTIGGQSGLIEQKIKIGLTHQETHSNTVENAQEVTKSISAGLSFKSGLAFEGVEVSRSISASASLSKTESTKITNEYISSSINTKVIETTIKCKEGSEGLFQFVVNGKYYYKDGTTNPATKTVKIETGAHWCVSNQNDTPKCPPSFCKRDFNNPLNDNCQECTSCNWDCYLERYPDLKAAYGNNKELAANHYNIHGENEGRDCKC